MSKRIHKTYKKSLLERLGVKVKLVDILLISAVIGGIFVFFLLKN